MISATLDFQILECDCCGKDNLQKTFKIENPVYKEFYLGYKCAGRWFKLNLSGNKYQALKRLNYKLSNNYTLEELELILGNIKVSQEEWQEESKWIKF